MQSEFIYNQKNLYYINHRFYVRGYIAYKGDRMKKEKNQEKSKSRFKIFLKKIFSTEYRAWTGFFISVILILGGLIGACSFQTAGGKVAVSSVSIPTQNGQWSTADIYKPDSATAQNKAPCVIVVPGFQRSKETQAAYSLELARRGIVVICIDPYAQGDSSASTSSQAATSEGYGLFAWVEYVTETPNLNYVDLSKVGAAGHSAGGNACVKAAAKFGQEVLDGERKTSRLSSVFISGYIRSFTSSDLISVRSNMGMSYAYYDEGAYQNETQKMKDEGTWMHGEDIANGDMRYAPEAIRFVNSGLSLNGEETISTTEGEIEIGKIYGNPNNHTLRIVNNERTLHALQPYDTVSISHMLDFFELAFDLEFSISTSSQIWWFKEIAQGVMLIGGFVLVMCLGALLLKTRAFSSLVHDIPEKRTQTKLDKVFFWVIFAASALIACFDFIPCAQWAQKMFPVAQSATMTWMFPQRMTNAVLLWAVLNGTIGFILFFGGHFLKKWIEKKCLKKEEEKDNTLDPIKIKPKELLKTFGLAMSLFGVFYSLILIVYTVFHVDFRFMFISARPILLPKMLLVSLMYIPLFFIFYLSNSIRVNCSMRPANWPDWLARLISVLGNSIGLILIMIIQYVGFAANGLVTYQNEWLYCNLLFGLIPMMMILPLMNRYFFNKTGKAYLGPMVTCLIFIFMTLTNTVCYIPL